MTGTWVNFFGIILGGLIGLLIKKGIPAHINSAIMKMEGLGICFIGANGVIAAMFRVDTVTGKLSDSGGLLLLISLVAGCLTGEFLRIDDRFNALGMFVEKRMGSQGFSRGFVTASLIFSIGAMAVIGPLYNVLDNNPTTLYIKTTLDFTTAIVLASVLGFGVIFSAIPVLIVQGSFALLARQIEPFILESDDLLRMFCMVGYAIVTSIGVNFLCDTKIKTANLLPALVVPVLYYFFLY